MGEIFGIRIRKFYEGDCVRFVIIVIILMIVRRICYKKKVEGYDWCLRES